MQYLGKITHPKDFVTKELVEAYLVQTTEYDASHASRAYNVGDFLIYNKTIYEVTSPIAINTALSVATKCKSIISITNLIKDRTKNRSSIWSYHLDATALSGETELSIEDLPVNGVITRIELRVTTAFVSSLDQNNIDVMGDSTEVLMDADWNDPNTTGNYITDCYYEISANGITVSHDLSDMTAGSAILLLHVFQPDD